VAYIYITDSITVCGVCITGSEFNHPTRTTYVGNATATKIRITIDAAHKKAIDLGLKNLYYYYSAKL